jgi:carboxyl-terminal processing protease
MRTLLRIVPALFFLGTLVAADAARTIWHVKLESGNVGPVEMYVRLTEEGDELQGHSLSGAVDRIRELPGAQADSIHFDDALFAFTAHLTDDGYVGKTTAPWSDEKIEFSMDEMGLVTGTLGGSLLGGRFTATQVDAAISLRDYPEIWTSIQAVVAAKVFQPKELATPAYQLFDERMIRIAEVATDDLDLLIGFHLGWTNDPFSHFQLRRSPISAQAMFQGLDSLRIGRESARVSFDGDVATLRVDTMMGNDTIEQIDAAYEAIAAAGSKALVIDLLSNGGGAFAVKPLVEHVIDEPFDAGTFVAQKWNAEHSEPPSESDIAAVEPWHGWKLSAFWQDIQDLGLMKLRFSPAEPNFDGPVFVVVNKQSASATELAVDAFRSSGLTTIVGEQTAGQMLSQSFFDAKDGFMLSLPVADYASTKHGRLEGVGVPVDVAVPSAQALETAQRLARMAISQ